MKKGMENDEPGLVSMKFQETWTDKTNLDGKLPEFKKLYLQTYSFHCIFMETQLRDTTAFKNTLRMYLFLNERSWMLLKLTVIHLAWSKMSRHLYNKSIQQYSRLLGKDVSPLLLPLAYTSRRFPHTLNIQDYYNLKPTCSPQTSPRSPMGEVLLAFLHLFNCWHRNKEEEQGLCSLLWKDQKISEESCGEGTRLMVTAERASWCSSAGTRLSRAPAAGRGNDTQWAAFGCLCKTTYLAIRLLLCCGQSEPLLQQTAATALVES